MKTENTFGTSSINKEIICYSCDIPEHQAFECHNSKGRKFCIFCKSSSLNNKTLMPYIVMCLGLRKQDFYFLFDTSFSVNCRVTTHIVNTDANFKPGHFIELADETRSNNFAKKRGIAVISSCIEGNLVKAILENTRVRLNRSLFVTHGKVLIFTIEFSVIMSLFTT